MTGLVKVDGTPLRVSTPSRDASMPATAYQAADPMSRELMGWMPRLQSADADLLPERDDITGRIRDLARNNGWASGAIRREIDNVIGAGLRLSYKPDYRALGLTADWAVSFARQVEARWRLWTQDPGRYCDAARHHTMGGLIGMAYRHYVVDGEALAALRWEPARGGQYATTVQVIDPDRLSNPWDGPDTTGRRAGVEVDSYCAATGYHIRRRHPADIVQAEVDAFTWDYLPRETPWGRPVTIHVYDKEREGQTRGVGRLTPVLKALKMGGHHEDVELQTLVVNSLLATAIESPFDHEVLAEALEDSGRLSAYQDLRGRFHEKRGITLGGVRVPTLFPGEKLIFQSANRPGAGFSDFQASVLRKIAAGLGLTYEQLSQDWSKTNYSSARAALLEVWKTLSTRREFFSQAFCTPIFGAWLEEAIERGDIELPPEAPDFWTARAAYCRCRWIGPGRGWVDPLKEIQAAAMRLSLGMSTLEDECAEQGDDYQEILEQLAREISEMPKGVLHPAQQDWIKLLGAHAAASTRQEAS
jgi:lambda family phage portal protein